MFKLKLQNLLNISLILISLELNSVNRSDNLTAASTSSSIESKNELDRKEDVFSQISINDNDDMQIPSIDDDSYNNILLFAESLDESVVVPSEGLVNSSTPTTTTATTAYTVPIDIAPSSPISTSSTSSSSSISSTSSSSSISEANKSHSKNVVSIWTSGEGNSQIVTLSNGLEIKFSPSLIRDKFFCHRCFEDGIGKFALSYHVTECMNNNNI